MYFERLQVLQFLSSAALWITRMMHHTGMQISVEMRLLLLLPEKLSLEQLLQEVRRQQRQHQLQVDHLTEQAQYTLCWLITSESVQVQGQDMQPSHVNN